MSFSNYIKDNNIFENYRKNEKMTRENSHTNYKVNIKSIINLYKKDKKEEKEEKNININRRILTPNFNNIEKSNNLLNFKNEAENMFINNICDTNDYNSIYKNIIILLNNIIIEYKNNENKLNEIFKLIYEYIYNINDKRNKRKKPKSSIKKQKSAIQIVDNIFKGNINEKIIKNNNRNNSSYEKSQINELNYLIYINELHKKIFNLEQELNIKTAKQILNKKIKLQDYNKYYSNNDLKIRSQSFTINSLVNNFLNKNLLENKNEKKNKLKISLKDIINDFNYDNNISYKLKLFKNKNYLLSHPKLNYNGYFNNNKGKLSNIINEKLNKIPLETFGVKMTTKLQTNKNSDLYLSFSPTKFKVEGIRSNKNIKNLNLNIS